MRLPIAVVFFLCSILHTNAHAQWTHGRLRVTPDGHYLQYTDGSPFFWLGDTGWELFHRLTLPEIRSYLDNRRQKGFNVIQAVILAEFDGQRTPNRYGDLPLNNLDPAQPNERYFQVIDSAVNMALHRNMVMALLPTWGDKVTKSWGAGPVLFDSATAYNYGRWVGNRYKDYPNIIWVLGGDRPPRRDSVDWTPVWRQMAKGIIDATDHRCLITYHPWGGRLSSSQYIHNETWLDMNMFQSGHGSGHDTPCWELVYRDRDILPTKPTLDAEPNYEDHPVNPWPKWDPANGYFRAYDVRRQCYRSVFAGACGVTYGQHAVWQFYSPREEKINYVDRYWTEAIDRPGAFQVGYMRKLIESHAAWNRIPDTTLILEGQGTKGEYCAAFRTPDGSLLMIYLPVGKKIVVNTSCLQTSGVQTRVLRSDKISWHWFDPRNNSYTKTAHAENKGKIDVTPPKTGTGNDWVLIVQRKKTNEDGF
jgi:Protein of unknown function (DUF4038)/Putative collagen-binding domain of a collagenase